jgi:hypothetical protein
MSTWEKPVFYQERPSTRDEDLGAGELPLNSDLQGLQKGNEIMFLQHT